MGSQIALVNLLLFISSLSHGADESNEGNEGWLCHDGIRCVQLSCRDDWLEVQGRQGHRGGHGISCGRSAEEKRILQTCSLVEPKVEEEASNASAQRRQPFH